MEIQELLDLIPTHIGSQAELNAWEEKNILQAQQLFFKKKYVYQEILTIDFIKKFHRHMFNQTWRWAGQFRTTAKNLGVNWYLISSELKKLCDDTRYQIEFAIFSRLEIAVRFHHRLVWIHPFPNGNGRHARLMADLLMIKLGQSRLTWGKQDLYKITPARVLYIGALQSADNGDYSKLIDFAML